ncbi:MAG: FAD-dependent oxidoreductase [Verrucomicrobiota bacterium]
MAVQSIAAEHKFDVVVFGATPGGVTAAVGAAREGATVALVEPMDIVGGVMTSGLSFSDSNQTDRRTLLGLFEETHLRIEAHYKAKSVTLPYSVAVKDTAHWTYEPHVAAKVFDDMLSEAKVKVFLNERLTTVKKDGARIQSFNTRSNTFTAKVFIDCTYEGDLMAKAGVSYVVGREGRKDYGESLAGKQFPKNPVKASPYDANGKLLPLMTAKDAGAPEAGDKGVMTYSYRLCITTNDANKVPFRKPANYDPAKYELVRRFMAVAQPKRPLFDFYNLPGGKWDGNNSIGGQISLGLVGENWGWPEASYEERDSMWQAHKDYTEGLIWFMMHDESVPQGVRREMKRWGLAKDEFAKWDHWPPVLYVREGRRMVGEYVVTQSDIVTNVLKPDTICIGSFPIDSHDVQRVATADGQGFIAEGTIFPLRIPGQRIGYRHQLPYRAITPKRAQCVNLLVPVSLSCTHVAISSIRVEPTWMALGQSAGIAAALAAKANRAVQDLPYATLRERLLAQKQVLEIPPLPTPVSTAPTGGQGIDSKSFKGIVLDDADARRTGTWEHSTNFKPFIGRGYLHDGNENKGSLKLVFQPEITQAGRYELRVAYSAHETRAAKVPITVKSDGKETKVLFNQQERLPVGESFRAAGVFDLSAGKDTVITISNEGTEGFVIVDAVQLVKME